MERAGRVRAIDELLIRMVPWPPGPGSGSTGGGKSIRARSKLPPMPCSPSFVEHALDLLSEIGPVEARRLFGGYGLYARGVGAMVGLLDDDELFLRIDDQTLHLFTAAGCRRWEYPGAGEGGTHYYRPPVGLALPGP